jgi:hypothetical protein
MMIIIIIIMWNAIYYTVCVTNNSEFW